LRLLFLESSKDKPQNRPRNTAHPMLRFILRDNHLKGTSHRVTERDLLKAVKVNH
jgi:hypothetical protein